MGAVFSAFPMGPAVSDVSPASFDRGVCFLDPKEDHAQISVAKMAQMGLRDPVSSGSAFARLSMLF